MRPGVEHAAALRMGLILAALRLLPVWRKRFLDATGILASVAPARSVADAVGGTPIRDEGLEASFARCAEITRRSSSNFYYAFMLLPAERRRALYAVYAFCRFVDDITDDVSVREPAQMLKRWREELDRVYRGQPTRPISRALAASVKRFDIPREPFEEIIAGVEMDLSRSRYDTFEELKLYCRRVASAVGLVCIEIFGYRNPLTRVYAENLGIAFQLTNILRDVGEDASRGRIYLPLEDLRRFHVEPEEILRGVHSERFAALMQFEATRARSYYDAAEAALSDEDRPSMSAADGMHAIYRALLERIIDDEYRVFARRHRISLSRKLYLVARVWINGRLRQAARRHAP
jgi:phytoene synthase